MQNGNSRAQRTELVPHLNTANEKQQQDKSARVNQNTKPDVVPRPEVRPKPADVDTHGTEDYYNLEAITRKFKNL